MNIDPKAVMELKAAVVELACNDWLKAVDDMKKAPEGGVTWNKRKDIKENCERFFFSERFALFSDIDPFTLLDRLEELSAQGRRSLLSMRAKRDYSSGQK